MRIPENLLCIGLLCLLIFYAAVIAASAQDDKAQNPFTRQDFNNSICFQKCHKPTDFSPSDKSAALWRMLFEYNGHDLFAEIPWKNAEEKAQLLQFLINHAHNPEPESEGIGVW